MGRKLTARDTLGRVLNYMKNPVSIAGTIIATVAALTIVIFLLAELAGGFHNPYLGIFAYVVLPALFLLGLVLIPIGLWRRRRALLAEGATLEELSEYPRLDFNDPLIRKIATIVLVLTGINAIILGVTSHMAVEKMDTVEFCGTTCHVVMQPEFTAYQASPHSRVRCVECHIGPGASWFVRSKIDGLRQVWKTALGTYSRPIETPLHNLRPARDTCEQCHWPLKHHGDKLKVFARFGTDEESSPSYTLMLMKTGGGSLDLGRHGGIHWWHIYSDNKIRYLASDTRRQEIAWVELTTADGEVRTYMREGEEPPSPELIAAEARVMDCIDCHNRPTHFFEPPSKALDRILENHGEFRELHAFKKVALAALEEEYTTHDEGMRGVTAAVLEHYTKNAPDLATGNRALVESAAAAVGQVYARISFPEMKTNWETHPNNIGHDDFPGCWRCHDDEMRTAGGEHVIPQDCETCHVFLIEDSPELPDISRLAGG